MKLLCILILFCGCVSQYHVGYHNLGVKKAYSIVSNSTGNSSREFEEKIIQAIVGHHKDGLKANFGVLLQKGMSDDTLELILKRVDEEFKPNGHFSHRKIIAARSSMDEAVFKVGYDFYDYIKTLYELEAEKPLIIQLFIFHNQNRKFKLCGIVLQQKLLGNEACNFCYSFLFPETEDKAKMLGRGYSVIKKSGENCFSTRHIIGIK